MISRQQQLDSLRQEYVDMLKTGRHTEAHRVLARRDSMLLSVTSLAADLERENDYAAELLRRQARRDARRGIAAIPRA